MQMEKYEAYRPCWFELKPKLKPSASLFLKSNFTEVEFLYNKMHPL